MKNIKLLAIVAVLLAITTHVSAWSGSGTTDTPWLISNEADWDELATQVNSGNSYYGKYFQLTKDISVTTMVGIPNFSWYVDMAEYGGPAFCGTFDGGGHTITVEYYVCESDNPDYIEDWAAAPFRLVGHGAVLSNVHTKGRISGCIGCAAGLIGCVQDIGNGKIDVTVEHCRSSVDISVYSLRGGDYARPSDGGIIGSTTGWHPFASSASKVNEAIRMYGKKNIQLRDCVFDGSLSGDNLDTGLGGLVGSTALNVDLRFDGCVFAPYYISLEHMETQSTFVHILREEYANMVHFEHCYYVNDPDLFGGRLDGMNLQGERVYSIRGKSGVTTVFSGYELIPLYDDFKLVKLYKDENGFKGFKMGNALYAQGTETLSLHLEGSNAGYNASSPSVLSVCGNPYELQMQNANCEITPAPITITTTSAELSDCLGGASKSITFTNPYNYPIKWVLTRGGEEVGKTEDYATVASPIDISSYLTAIGSYTFTISAKLSEDCIKEDVCSVTFEVYALPAAKITSTSAQLSSCLSGEDKAVALSTYDEQIQWVLKRGSTVVHTGPYTAYTAPIAIPATYLTKSGDYTFTISAKTVHGCTTENIDEVSFKLYANPTASIASVSSDLSGCLTGENVPVALSTYAEQIKWVLKHGNTVVTEDYKTYTAPIEIPAMYLTEAGSYTFTISAKTANGCEKENIDEVSFEMYDGPTATITTDPFELSSCLTDEDKSIALSTDADKIKWVLTRNGELVLSRNYAAYTDPIAIPAAYLTKAGDYTFTISAMSANGCEAKNISSVSFEVYALPAAEITTTPDELNSCLNGKNKSVALSTYDEQIKWVLTRDGSVVVSQNYTTYTAPIEIPASYLSVAGSYTFSISARTDNGCEKENIDEVSFEMYDAPAAAITTDPSELSSCLNGENKSVELSTYNEQIKWVLKRGSTVVHTEPYASYSAPIEISSLYLTEAGSYTFAISAKTVNGCETENISSVSFDLYADPVVEIKTDPSELNGCLDGEDKPVELSAYANDSIKWVLEHNGVEVHTEPYATYYAPIYISAADYLTDVGSYTFTISAKTANGCEKENISSVSFELYADPTVAITTTSTALSSCLTGEKKSVALSSYDDRIKWVLRRDGLEMHTEPYATYSDRIEIPAKYLTEADSYTFTISAMTAHGCETKDISSVSFELYADPTATITTVSSELNSCMDGLDKTIDLSTKDDSIKWVLKRGNTVVHTEDYDIYTTASITIPATYLTQAGDYTFAISAKTVNGCEKEDEVAFTIYPTPTVTFDTPAPIKSDVTGVDVTIHLSDATQYDYDFDYLPTIHQHDEDVSANKTTIKINTAGLGEGTYTLYVTPKNIMTGCAGKTESVTIIINNAPTIVFTKPKDVCDDAQSLIVKYKTSDDAITLKYHVLDGNNTTVIAEQPVSLAQYPDSMFVDISHLSYGTYTLIGKVSYEKPDHSIVEGGESSVGFTILAPLSEKPVSQPKRLLGCDETYTATIEVHLANAAGRTIYASYTDGGVAYNLLRTTDPLNPTTTFTLSGLTDHDNPSEHQVKVYIDGIEGCDTLVVKYPEPQLKTITAGFTVTALPKSCDQDEYTLTGIVDANCEGDTIVVEYNDSYYAEVPDSIGGSRFSIENIPTQGGVNRLKAYFKGKPCSMVESERFFVPPTPSASIQASMPETVDCDQKTFNLDFTLDYTYQGEGTLTVWVDGFTGKTVTYTYNSVDDEHKYWALLDRIDYLYGTIEGLPADGSKGLKLNYKFDADRSCEGSIDLPAFPRSPQITAVDIVPGSIPKLVPGGRTYSPEFKVSYKYTDGETLVLEYQKANGDWAWKTTKVSTAGKSTFTGLTFDDVAMGTRKVYVYFYGSTCKEEKEYITPGTFRFVSAEQVNTGTCEHLRYDITGFVSFVGEPEGDIVVELDANNRCTIPNADCIGKSGTSLPFEIKDIELDIPATGMPLIAYFSGLPAGNETTWTELFYNPAVPHMEISDPAYSIPACNSTLTNLTFNLTYIRQQGDLHVAVDGVEQPCSLSEDILPGDDIARTVAVTVPDLPADDKVHPLHVWFDGSGSCDMTTNLPQAPFGAEISDIREPLISDEFCDADDYTVTVTFTVTNGLGKDVTATCKGVTVTQRSVDGTNTIIIPNVPRNAKPNRVELSFADATNAVCEPLTVEYTQHPKPQLLELTIDDPGEIPCDAATYRLPVAVSCRNLGTAELTMWLEDGEGNKLPLDGAINTDSETATLVFTNAIDVPADNHPYTLHVTATGDNWRDGCNTLTAEIPAVWRPAITAITATPDKSYAHCDDSYSVSGRIGFARGGGKYPVVACYEGNTLLTPTITYTAQTDAYVDYTISGLTNSGAQDCSVKAYFADYAPACAEAAEMSAAFVTPAEIRITGFTATAQPKNCGDTDYTVTGTITANYATDALIAVTDGTNTIQVQASVSGEAYTFSGITLRGTQHLTAAFVAHDCSEAPSEDFTAPAMPILAATMEVDTVFDRGTKEYHVTVAVTAISQRGECYVLDSIVGGATTIRLIGSGTFTITRPATAELHYIVVRYPATCCEVVIPEEALDINPYINPQPFISLTPIAPLCDTEKELVLPFAVKQGDIAEATLTLTGSTVANAALDINATHDTLTYTLPDKLTSGKHTAIVEARNALGCFTTAELSIDVAQDSIIYSKWSEVLMVDNHEGLYTAYQWYQDDQPVGNEVVLHVPGGMSGKRYYCRLTLRDGSQIYTCEQVFDDIPRSADHQKETAANTIAVQPRRVQACGTVTVQQTAEETLHLLLTNATGQRVAEYTQTQSTCLIDMPAMQGVYLLRIVSGSDTQIVKIVVY